MRFTRSELDALIAAVDIRLSEYRRIGEMAHDDAVAAIVRDRIAEITAIHAKLCAETMDLTKAEMELLGAALSSRLQEYRRIVNVIQDIAAATQWRISEITELHARLCAEAARMEAEDE